ncbi:hypothetical protein BT96DRAFT_93309 [Gymnopus androsaceus JB14]|uniref:Uncharacterized protein n=1 Tax=Gymnopus androsaceus JB14 TaxID=1447944 RepID=A0A6A4HH82_9AGAR|nr:hypothetical protein BT96DRAFT_93309 [Gymnopus androsaceus JB14]
MDDLSALLLIFASTVIGLCALSVWNGEKIWLIPYSRDYAPSPTRTAQHPNEEENSEWDIKANFSLIKLRSLSAFHFF